MLCSHGSFDDLLMTLVGHCYPGIIPVGTDRDFRSVASLMSFWSTDILYAIAIVSASACLSVSWPVLEERR